VLDSKTIFQKVIKSTQVQVRKILARKISNRQAFSRIAPGHLVINDPIEQGSNLEVFEQSSELGLEDRMVYRRKVFSNIAFQKIVVSPGKFICTGHSGVIPLSSATGVTVEDEFALNQRFQNIADRVVDHPVSKVGAADLADFWLSNFKHTVWFGAVGSSRKLVLKCKQLALHRKKEGRYGRVATLPSKGSPGCGVKILERDYLLEEVTVSPHGLASCCFNQPPNIFPAAFNSFAECL
jgi:hypothetical protein